MKLDIENSIYNKNPNYEFFIINAIRKIKNVKWQRAQ